MNGEKIKKGKEHENVKYQINCNTCSDILFYYYKPNVAKYVTNRKLENY